MLRFDELTSNLKICPRLRAPPVMPDPPDRPTGLSYPAPTSQTDLTLPTYLPWPTYPTTRPYLFTVRYSARAASFRLIDAERSVPVSATGNSTTWSRTGTTTSTLAPVA